MIPKRERHLWLRFSDALALVAGWGVIAFLVVAAFRSSWHFATAISSVADIVWPLGAVAGLLLLLAAHACRSTQEDLSEAYSFMRAAALSFLLAFFALWLRSRHFL